MINLKVCRCFKTFRMLFQIKIVSSGMKMILLLAFVINTQFSFAQNAMSAADIAGALYKINQSQDPPDVKREKIYGTLSAYIKTDPKNREAFMFIGEQVNFRQTQVDSLLELMDISLNNAPEKNVVLNLRRRLLVAETGKPFPEVIFTDTALNTFSTTSLRGKIVLIDVWASWCVPCREELPGLKAVYEKFKQKNFEIIGVSFDDEKKNWLAAVKAEKIYWPQYCELRSWRENSFAKKFSISSIPSDFLLDKNGIILGQNLSAAQVADILSKQ